MSLTSWEISQFDTPFIFSFSILILSGSIITFKNHISFIFYLHFSSFTYRLFSANLFITSSTTLLYLSFFCYCYPDFFCFGSTASTLFRISCHLYFLYLSVSLKIVVSKPQYSQNYILLYLSIKLIFILSLYLL